ncbi:MAG: hypothetical protein IJ626_03940, partial [Muribaculaceae bacterium]|nr:hypothetical protein [Muribaculaceae bacterium]
RQQKQQENNTMGDKAYRAYRTYGAYKAGIRRVTGHVWVGGVQKFWARGRNMYKFVDFAVLW